jgi:hypothetical protein
VDLAAHTGLRLGDLPNCHGPMSAPVAIILWTGKSRGRREVIIPIYGALKRVLDAVPKRSTAILTNSCAAVDGEQFRDRVQPGEDRRRHGRAGTCSSTICAAPPRPASTGRPTRVGTAGPSELRTLVHPIERIGMIGLEYDAALQAQLPVALRQLVRSCKGGRERQPEFSRPR